MTVAQAMANAQAVTGQVFDAATLRRWLSELDGQLALDLYRADAWTPYSADDDDALLLVPYPWDGLYVHHLEAMTYFSNGEYDRYQNALTMRENALGEFKRFVQRTKGVCGRIRVVQAGDGGTAVTIIDEGAPIWKYISAYGTAVLRGRAGGSVDEWLDSLKGEKGDKGEPGDVEFDDLTPEQKAELKGDTGEQGPKGDDGEDGVSPVLSIGTVTTLPVGSPATASMGGTQAAPTLNLGIPVSGITNVWAGSQTAYNAMASHDPNTIYLITS